MSKYGNKKVEIDGMTFDSQAEAARYRELGLLQQAGAIAKLECHPKFLLQEKFVKGGKTWRAIHYAADFKYWDKEQKRWVVEDVKGMETAVFKLKRKLFEYRYKHLSLEVVKAGGRTPV